MFLLANAKSSYNGSLRKLDAVPLVQRSSVSRVHETSEGYSSNVSVSLRTCSHGPHSRVVSHCWRALMGELATTAEANAIFLKTTDMRVLRTLFALITSIFSGRHEEETRAVRVCSPYLESREISANCACLIEVESCATDLGPRTETIMGRGTLPLLGASLRLDG